jgi:phosphoribosylformimino-5-aminoimidazole carboxamide ribotide isomerase
MGGGSTVRVIPVLDLMGGRAVLACRGLRKAYAPAASVLVPAEQAGDALALARALRTRFGCDECYVADLDAIAGGRPQRALLRGLARVSGRLLVDGGVASAAGAREALADGAARVAVGLETLPAFDTLAEIVRVAGSRRVVFSLDLREGTPGVLPGAPHRGTPFELACAAVRAGAAAILVLDLARVGAGLGVDVALVREIRRAQPAVEILAGGGIGSRSDLERLADTGCDGALVATVLRDGGVNREDIEALRRWGHASDSR